MTSCPDVLRMGGELEFSIEAVCAEALYESPSLPTRHTHWMDTGRSALLLAAMDILARGGSAIAWLPAFCCAAVATAFEQAGFSLRYYSAAELHGEAAAELDPQPGETLVLIHYFGHRNADRLRQAAAWRAAGVVVVEDAVQAALTSGLGTVGAYAVTSLRKFLAQPDGALLGSAQELELELAPCDEEFVTARAVAKLARGAGLDEQHFLPLIEASESCLERTPIVPRHMSWLSRRLMTRTDLEAVASRRRSNHRVLHAGVAQLSPLLRPVLGELRQGEVPLGLALRVGGGRRDELRQYLARHQVYCPIHWPLPHVPKIRETLPDHRLADEIITLPVDQRMDERHAQRLMHLLAAFISEHT